MKIYIPLEKLKALLEKLAFAPVIPTLCVSFALGILLARSAQPPLAAAAVLSIAALAAALASQRRLGAVRLAHLFIPLIAAAALFAGAFLYLVDEAVSPSPSLTRILRAAESKKQTLFVEAIVESSPSVHDKRARFNVRVTKAGPSPNRMKKVSGIAQASTSLDEVENSQLGEGPADPLFPVVITRRLPRYSDRIRFEARASSLDFLDPPYQQHFKTLGVSGFLFVPDVIPIRVTGRARKFVLFRWGKALGERFRATISRTIPSPASLVLGQIMFGKIVRTSPELKDKFRAAGVVHVLVVSGMHVWMLLSSFLLLAFLWKRNPFVSFAILGVVLLLFFSMSGGGPSVTRATLMGLVYLGAMLTKRDYDRVSALFLAGLFLLVLNPRAIFHPGPQLSFLACAGLIFTYPLLNSILPRLLRSRLLAPLFLSLCATLPIYPVIAYHFDYVSLVSPISNVFVIPCVGILLPFGFAYSTLTLLIPQSALILAPVLTFSVNFLIAMVEWFAHLPLSSIAVSQPGIAAILVYFLSLFSWVMFIHSMKRGRDEAITYWMLAGGMGAGFLLWSWLFSPPSDRLDVTFIDVGEGDSIVIDAPYDLNSRRRFRLLIDGGGGGANSSYNSGKERVGRTLAQLGISHLDAVLLTHPDHDHMDGLLWVLDNIPVDRWIDPGFQELSTRKNTSDWACFNESPYPDPSTESTVKTHPHKDEPSPMNASSSQMSTYKTLLRKVRNKKIERIVARKNTVLKLKSGITFHILYPDDDDLVLCHLSTNELSAVLKLTYSNASFLFTGDIEKYGEFTLRRDFYENLSSTVLKVPHHGGSTSSSKPFIEKVRPLISIISVGRRNPYGHPHKRVLGRYKKIKSPVFRTDKHGDITVSTDGKQLFLKTRISRVLFTRHLDSE